MVRAIAAEGLERRAIRTSCLGFGDDYDEDLLVALSTATARKIDHYKAGKLRRMSSKMHRSPDITANCPEYIKDDLAPPPAPPAPETGSDPSDSSDSSDPSDPSDPATTPDERLSR